MQCRFFETFPWLSRTFLFARWNHKDTNINIFHCPTPWIWDVPITDNVPLRLRVFPISIEIYCSSISCNIRWESELICKTGPFWVKFGSDRMVISHLFNCLCCEFNSELFLSSYGKLKLTYVYHKLSTWTFGVSMTMISLEYKTRTNSRL